MDHKHTFTCIHGNDDVETYALVGAATLDGSEEASELIQLLSK